MFVQIFQMVNDFKLFKESQIICSPNILGDSGYQGLANLHPNSKIPVKKTKGKSLNKKHIITIYLVNVYSLRTLFVELKFFVF